ncbi:MAG: hypothetical protein GWN81_07950 [Phycisphaerae bacterium]|nr:hypothetical protein [Phycisphaerae bacterium]NIP52101.1 hypothetical protein [Phycisphaerae bacterium]NIU08770.1 hypothetical protein [Phycisphaerae bacterium]NIX28066.1 hypothetical protein [Phycisphaerae bacterium]
MITLRLYPILSDNRRTNFKPRFADSTEVQQIRTRLIENSDEVSELDSSLLNSIDEFGHYLELPIGSRNIINT